MTQTQTVQLLTHLNAYDLQQFRKFLNSPFHNHRKDVIQLFEFLLVALLEEPKLLTKEKAWQATYPDQSFNDQQLRLVTSYLHRLAEQFLAQRIHQEEDKVLRLGRVRAYRQLNLEKPYHRSLIKARKALEKQPLRSDRFLQKVYEIELEYHEYTSGQKRSKDASLSLQTSIDAFDRYFVASKLKYGCLALSNQQVFKNDYQIAFLQEVIDHIDHHPTLLENPAIGIYYYCILTITSQEDESNFEKLRRLIDLHKEQFDPSEIRSIYLMLLNYCTRRVNQGSEKYMRMSFDLYRAGVEKRYLFENDRLSSSSFSNLVFIGISLREFEWVQDFIVRFKKDLPREDQENTYCLTFASLKYHQQKYDEARDLLNNFYSKDPLFLLKIKTLQTRIYYELNEFDLLESHLFSMNSFLRRKEVSAPLKAPYLEFIKLTRKLIRLPDWDHKKRQALREEIGQMRVRSLKSWLLKQLPAV